MSDSWQAEYDRDHAARRTIDDAYRALNLVFVTSAHERLTNDESRAAAEALNKLAAASARIVAVWD